MKDSGSPVPLTLRSAHRSVRSAKGVLSAEPEAGDTLSTPPTGSAIVLRRTSRMDRPLASVAVKRKTYVELGASAPGRSPSVVPLSAVPTLALSLRFSAGPATADHASRHELAGAKDVKLARSTSRSDELTPAAPGAGVSVMAPTCGGEPDAVRTVSVGGEMYTTVVAASAE